MQKMRFDILDGMRGIAAFLVMAYHYYIQDGFLFLQNAFMAVDVFFIISGFVITHTYAPTLARGASIRHYFYQRLIRIYPCFAVGLLLGAIFLLMASMTGQTSLARRDVVASVLDNLVFIPYLNDHTIGIEKGAVFPANPPMWSIFFEMAACVWFVFAYKLDTRRLLTVSIAFLAVIVIYGAGQSFVAHRIDFAVSSGWSTLNLFGGFPRALYGFTMGVLLYKLGFGSHVTVWDKSKLRLSVFAGTLYAVLIAILMCPYGLHGAYFLFVITIAAPLLVIAGSGAGFAGGAGLAVSRGLGWLSYPVYCLHVPVFRGMRILDAQQGLSERAGVSVQLLSIGATIGLALLVGKLIDEPLRRVLRNWRAIMPARTAAGA